MDHQRSRRFARSSVEDVHVAGVAELDLADRVLDLIERGRHVHADEEDTDDPPLTVFHGLVRRHVGATEQCHLADKVLSGD